MFAGTQDTFFIKYLLAKAASCKDFGLLVVDVSVAFMHARTISNLELLADEFKNHFLVKKAEIVSLRPEHQKETHLLKRRISVDDFGWHVELYQRYVKKLVGCNGDESLQMIEGTREQPRRD